MNKEEIIYDHYKDTCALCRNMEKDRNRLFIYVCLLLTVLFLFVVSETNITGMLYAWMKERYACDLSLSADTIQSFIWLLLLYFTVRYYQQCIGIERLYVYIHALEKSISTALEVEIGREGESYDQGFPKVLNFIWALYTIIFPVIFMILIIIKVALEIWSSRFGINMCIHILLCVFNIILVLCYSCFLHAGRMKRCLRRIGLLDIN